MTGRVYYNEFNEYAAQWLVNLIDAKLIPAGIVDSRSILEVTPSDLQGFTQCHFFAGIGGWPLALRTAGWADDRPVWTGSCPCQPFSAAGNNARQSDERHLWPHWAGIIGKCRPATIFGEQVTNAISAGWLDDVFHDLEKEKYACAAAVLPACSSGAPHRRDRIFFVANAAGKRLETGSCTPFHEQGSKQRFERLCCGSDVANTDNDGKYGTAQSGSYEKIDDNGGEKRPQRTIEFEGSSFPGIISGDVVNASKSGSQRHNRNDGTAQGWQAQDGSAAEAGFWHGVEWWNGPDGKARPVKPSIHLLVDGISGDLGYCRTEVLPKEFKDGKELVYGTARAERLHGYGNAIERFTAAGFIKSAMSVL